MGNCFIIQQKMIIKVIKTNGEVLEYKSPIKVHQVLSQNANHEISDVLPMVRYLGHQDNMIVGHIYYLFLLPVDCLESVKNHGTSVRIKLVVTKHEYEVMLQNGGVSVSDLVGRIAKDGSLIESEDDGKWKPSLESIFEST